MVDPARADNCPGTCGKSLYDAPDAGHKRAHEGSIPRSGHDLPSYSAIGRGITRRRVCPQISCSRDRGDLWPPSLLKSFEPNEISPRRRASKPDDSGNLWVWLDPACALRMVQVASILSNDVSHRKTSSRLARPRSGPWWPARLGPGVVFTRHPSVSPKCLGCIEGQGLLALPKILHLRIPVAPRLAPGSSSDEDTR